MTSYYSIFKTDNLTKKTILVCGGSHDDEHQCRIHWQSYMYGFMDGLFELVGAGKFQMMTGSHELSFQVSIDGKMDVEYFMLLDDEGSKLISEISK